MEWWQITLGILYLPLLYRYLKLRKNLANSLDKNKQILSQKKSSEVLTGHIAEKLAPFLDNFKYDPQKSTFLGQPIDYLVFEEDEIIFVEIKSGNARLSKKQKNIKKLIEDGKVSWTEIRIK
jgi:predicted Holliday junction resolvase-like endonuclease